MSVTLLLIRHGQTEENLAHILQGQQDGHLTSEGIQQAVNLGKQLLNEHIDTFISSDLGRALDTSRLINQSLCLNIIKEPLLRERDFGKYTGCPYGTQIPSDDKSVETVEQLYNRACKWLESILHQYDDHVILAVSHGLFLRFIQAAIMGVHFKNITPMHNTEIRRYTVHSYFAPSLAKEHIETVES